EDDRQILSLLKGKRGLVLLNKSDLPAVVTREEMERETHDPVLLFSAREGTGKRELEKTILEMFDAGEIGKNQQVTVTNLRHREALEKALSYLQMVRESIHQRMPEDFFSIDLMGAYRELGLILGEE